MKLDVHVSSACGRMYLSVGGVAVAMQMDPCRDADVVARATELRRDDPTNYPPLFGPLAQKYKERPFWEDAEFEAAMQIISKKAEADEKLAAFAPDLLKACEWLLSEIKGSPMAAAYALSRRVCAVRAGARDGVTPMMGCFVARAIVRAGSV